MVKRAFKDTLSFFGWNKRTLIVPILLWLLGAIIYYFWQGRQAMLGEMAVAVSFALIPTGIFLLGLFLFHLIRAPVYIKWEKEKEKRLLVSLCDNYEPGDGSHWLRLRVDNSSLMPIANCYGKVVSYKMKIDELLSDEEIRNTFKPIWHPKKYLTNRQIDYNKPDYGYTDAGRIIASTQRDLTLKLVRERLQGLAWLLDDEDVKVGGPGSKLEVDDILGLDRS